MQMMQIENNQNSICEAEYNTQGANRLPNMPFPFIHTMLTLRALILNHSWELGLMTRTRRP